MDIREERLEGILVLAPQGRRPGYSFLWRQHHRITNYQFSSWPNPLGGKIAAQILRVDSGPAHNRNEEDFDESA